MISLTRERNETAIDSAFQGQTPKDRLVGLMKLERDIKRGDLEKYKFKSLWGDTKKQLQKETNGKCAYCESTTTESMHGDVEHYRPKSEYWWLAYVYDNYLASCQLCNQKFKKAFFEIENSDKRLPEPEIAAQTTDAEILEMAEASIPDPLDQAAVAAFEQQHREERPLIINPYVDPPEEFFAWEDSGAGAVDLVPIADKPETQKFVDAAVRLLGLNRADLQRRRFAHYSNYALWVEVAENDDVPEPLRDKAQAQIETFKKPDSPYAGMILFFENQRTAQNSG